MKRIPNEEEEKRHNHDRQQSSHNYYRTMVDPNEKADAAQLGESKK
jgi:hypothetical protein